MSQWFDSQPLDRQIWVAVVFLIAMSFIGWRIGMILNRLATSRHCYRVIWSLNNKQIGAWTTYRRCSELLGKSQAIRKLGGRIERRWADISQ